MAVPDRCSARVLVMDERWGGIERTCENEAGHVGLHSASMGACDPPAFMAWIGSYGDG
jgi:hypothetical protein